MFLDRRRAGHLPAHRIAEHRLRIAVWVGRDGHQADRREISGGRLLKAAGGIFHQHVHVGLPGAQPDIANDDILDRHGLRPGDGKRLPLVACREGPDLDEPATILIGGGDDILAGDADSDLGSGGRPAPHRRRHVTRQYHVVRKKRVHERERLDAQVLRLGGPRRLAGGETEKQGQSHGGGRKAAAPGCECCSMKHGFSKIVGSMARPQSFPGR